MKPINEKLLTDLEGKEIDASKLDRSDYNSLKQLVDNSNYFYQDSVKYIKDLIIDSIRERGLDTAQNPFLWFAANPNIKSVQVPFKHGEMIKTDLEDGKLKGLISTKVGNNQSFVSKWIFDKRTYEGDDYKLALLLAVAENPDGYGKIKDFPLEDVLNASSESAVNQAIANWANKEDDPSPTKRGSRSALKDKVPDDVEDWVTYLKTLFSKDDAAMIEKLAKAVYKKGAAAAVALKNFTDKLFAEKTKNATVNNQSEPQEVQA